MATQRRHLSRHGGADYNRAVERDFMITCPYNSSHVIPSSHFGEHVNLCYKMHCEEQEAKKEKSLFSICRHDPTHHVRKEELRNHELACEWDRKIDEIHGHRTKEITGATYSGASISGSDWEHREWYESESDESESETPDT